MGRRAKSPSGSVGGYESSKPSERIGADGGRFTSRQHRHRCIISPLRLSADEWYPGVYQVLGIREEIDRDGVDVPLPSGSRRAGRPEPLPR